MYHGFVPSNAGDHEGTETLLIEGIYMTGREELQGVWDEIRPSAGQHAEGQLHFEHSGTFRIVRSLAAMQTIIVDPKQQVF